MKIVLICNPVLVELSNAIVNWVILCEKKTVVFIDRCNGKYGPMGKAVNRSKPNHQQHTVAIINITLPFYCNGIALLAVVVAK